jgi:hypothetical protein
MNYTDFLITQIPMCRKNPLQAFLEENQSRAIELSNRSIRDFNEDFFDKNCEHKLFCGATICNCIGRIIPKYPEVDAIMQDMKKEWNRYKSKEYPNLIRVEETTYKDKEVWKLNIITCKQCNFKSKCDGMCLTVNDNINRIEGSEDILGEVDEHKKGILHINREEFIHDKIDLGAYDMAEPITGKNRGDIPWAVLTEKQREVIILKYLYEKEWDEIAQEMNRTEHQCQKSLNAAVVKLKKHVVIAEKNKTINHKYLTDRLDGLSYKEIATKYNKREDTIRKKIQELLRQTEGDK